MGLVRDWEKGGKAGMVTVGGKGRIYTYRYTVTTRMTPALRRAVIRTILMSLIVRDKVTRTCPQTSTSEEKGEPKRIRTEVPFCLSA